MAPLLDDRIGRRLIALRNADPCIRQLSAGGQDEVVNHDRPDSCTLQQISYEARFTRVARRINLDPRLIHCAT